jgi:cell division protein FtsQ
MIRHLRTLLLGLAAVAAGGALSWLLVASPWLRYESLTVEGAVNANVAELRHLADMPTGTPLVRLDLDAAVAGVARHPWVKSVSASRQFPNAVRLVVVERSPVALLLTDTLYLVDDSGVPFLRARAGQLDLPVLTGLAELSVSQPELARRLVGEGLAWLEAAETHGGVPVSEISELRFADQSGYTLFLRNGGEVLLGFAETERVARLPRLVAQGLDLSVPHRVDLVSSEIAVVTPL